MHMGLQEKSPNNSPSPCYVFSGPARNHKLTTFDITLARAFTNQWKTKSTAPKTFQYVISSTTPENERRFLEFNTDSRTAPDQVNAARGISFACLVNFKQISAKKPFNPVKIPFQIVVAQSHKEGAKSEPRDWRLLMSPHDIPPPDDPFQQERARPGLLLRKAKGRRTQVSHRAL